MSVSLSAERGSRVAILTVALGFGGVASRIEQHPDQLEKSDDERAEGDGAQRERRSSDEGRERRVLGLKTGDVRTRHPCLKLGLRYEP